MNKKPLLKCLTAAILGTAAIGVQAAPITVSGDFVLLKVSDDGTIGDGNALPALVFDPTGTGTFDFGTDYVAPGTPFEAFGFRSDETGLLGNNNASSAGSVSSSDDFNLVSLADTSGASAFDNEISYQGASKDGLVNVSHTFFFNNDDQRVNITTVLTAIDDLTGVSFSRAVDPDPDNVPGGTAATNNNRGLDRNGDGDFDDADDVSPGDLVTSVGQVSGRPLGLFTSSAVTHNVGIETACCSVFDPLEYLAGGDFAINLLGFDSTGDDGLGLAFDIGDMAAGDSITLNYAYVMGLTFEDIDIPDDGDDDDDGEVPVPATLALFGAGLLGAGVARRRRKS